jgi:8-oxo-dGTP pyrophosphatase MutT (NUDIX family)
MGRVWRCAAGGIPVGALVAWVVLGAPASVTVLAVGGAGGAFALCLAGVVARRAAIRGSAARRLWTFAVSAAALGLGAAALVGIAAAVAARSEAGYRVTEAGAAAIYDLDASVATRPLPRCAAKPRRIEVLLNRGARPRLAGDGDRLWFDARTPDGRRQLHRLDRRSGRVVCWTCGEAGNNWRPAPAETGSGVAFETDRHASWWDPTNTEIHLVSGRGEAPERRSRRLTFGPGPDGHAVFRPAARRLLWSRREGLGYAVVSAPIRSVHGGLILGGIARVASGGAAWTAPLAWSPDARSLVVARGNPFGTVAARRLDLATGREADLGSDIALGGVAFTGDGGWVAVATARRARSAGRLPSRLGFLLAPWADRVERDRPLYRDSGIRVGEPWAPGAPLELGEFAGWGGPTGLALSPDGTVLILGQRRSVGGRIEERLLEITLACRPGSSGIGAAPASAPEDVDYPRRVPSLEQIRRALAAHRPVTLNAEGRRRAAVAMVLREAGGPPEVLFIERARRPGDPWSGHMAFPGGRVDPGDAGPRSAAERETREEVGLRPEQGERLGRLDDLQGHHVAGVPSLVVSAFVYHVTDPPPLVPNHEVEDAFWFPLRSLREPERQVDYPLGIATATPYPGIRVGASGRQVVWGLTYRFLEVFLRIAGRPLPERGARGGAAPLARRA